MKYEHAQMVWRLRDAVGEGEDETLRLCAGAEVDDEEEEGTRICRNTRDARLPVWLLSFGTACQYATLYSAGTQSIEQCGNFFSHTTGPFGESRS